MALGGADICFQKSKERRKKIIQAPMRKHLNKHIREIDRGRAESRKLNMYTYF